MMAQFVFGVTRIGTREAPSSSYNTQNETGVVDLASLLAPLFKAWRPFGTNIVEAHHADAITSPQTFTSEPTHETTDDPPSLYHG